MQTQALNIQIPFIEAVLQQNISNLEPEDFILTTSFSPSSGAILHMYRDSGIPIVHFDTQYLHDETYEYKERLIQELGLEVLTYKSPRSPAEQEDAVGQRWLGNRMDEFNRENKIEPRNRAVKELGTKVLISGIRYDQGDSRQNRERFEMIGDGPIRFYPLIDWDSQRVIDYMLKHNIPFHPLGYPDTRLGNKFEPTYTTSEKKECGLHLE